MKHSCAMCITENDQLVLCFFVISVSLNFQLFCQFLQLFVWSLPEVETSCFSYKKD